MYKQRTVHSSGTSKRHPDRFAGTWTPWSHKTGNGRVRNDLINERQRAWRVKRISQRASLFFLVSVLILSLGWLSFELLLRSDIFRMTSLFVQGNQVTTEQQILQAAGVKKGSSLLTLDVDSITEGILKEPWIERVWVKRQWPSTVEIIVSEYKPFALVNLERDGNKQLYYMNNAGIVFAPSTAQRDLDYPVVNGAFLSADLQGKEFRKDSPGRMALDFLRLAARGNQILTPQAISEINVDPEKGIIVYLVDHPFPIHMGKDKLQVRFSRLVKVLAQLYREEKIKGVAEIRMDYAENKILVARTDDAK